MEAYNVGVFAVSQNSYLLLNDVEVFVCMYVFVRTCMYTVVVCIHAGGTTGSINCACMHA